MKRFFSILLSFLLFFAAGTVSAQASEQHSIASSTSIDYLDNGDYIVIEVFCPSSGLQKVTTASTIPGSKTLTYYNAAGTSIWSVTVSGWFTYTYGVSASATSATVAVDIKNSNASFVSKSAYTSGNTAAATGTVRYDGANMSRSVSVSCDKYGNVY